MPKSREGNLVSKVEKANSGGGGESPPDPREINPESVVTAKIVLLGVCKGVSNYLKLVQEKYSSSWDHSLGCLLNDIPAL